MPTGPTGDPHVNDEAPAGSLLGPTPSTYSYNDALLMGRMTPEELAKVRSELFGEEVEPEPDSSPTVPSSRVPPLQSRPPPTPSKPALAAQSKPPSASGAWSPVKGSTPPPPPKGPLRIPPSPMPEEVKATSRSKPPPLPVEAKRSVPPPPLAPLPSESKQGARPKPPPMPQRTPAQQIKARIDANDYAEALSLCERELLATPESAEIQRYAEACRAMLARAYLGHLGRRSDVPRIVMGGAQLRHVNLDRWAAFVMSRVDGESSIDEIVDISGMVELDTLRILYELVQQGVVGVSPNR
ncbi:MAG: hypothetical protein ABI193_15325 [Minicystis sp.]